MHDWTSGQESDMDSTRVVAVDVGGTFTDVCVLDQTSGELAVAKVASTSDPIDGVMAGVEQAGVDLSNTALFCHGTTVATNALITRKLPKAAMVCTRGFRDVVEIGRGTRDDNCRFAWHRDENRGCACPIPSCNPYLALASCSARASPPISNTSIQGRQSTRTFSP